jgi:hypothetical protein
MNPNESNATRFLNPNRLACGCLQVYFVFAMLHKFFIGGSWWGQLLAWLESTVPALGWFFKDSARGKYISACFRLPHCTLKRWWYNCVIHFWTQQLYWLLSSIFLSAFYLRCLPRCRSRRCAGHHWCFHSGHATQCPGQEHVCFKCSWHVGVAGNDESCSDG